MQQTRCINCMKEIAPGTRVCPHCGYDQQAAQMTHVLRPNTILRGRYLVGRVIGKGGFGITYVGFDLTLEMKVAIKEYYPSGIASRNNSWSNQVVWESEEQGQDTKMRRVNSMEHVLKEARRAAKLSAVSSVVRVTDAFQENDTAYIVMDFIEGITLKEYLSTHGAMTWKECEQLLFPVMDDLAEAHDLGIIHRDISPDNIMIRPDGTAKLLDLGAAVDVNLNNGHASTLVVKNNFSAWEQYYESGQIGSWTDVYAFAAMLYYCMTGELMQPVMDRMATQSEITFPEQPEIPEHVKETLINALAIRQEDRIQDMREFERQLAGKKEEIAAKKDAEKNITVTGVAVSANQNGSAVVPESVYKLSDGDKTQPWVPKCETEEVDPDKTRPWTAEDARMVAGAQSAAGTGAAAKMQDDGNKNPLSSSDNDSGEDASDIRKRKKIASIVAAVCLLVLLAGIVAVSYLSRSPSETATLMVNEKDGDSEKNGTKTADSTEDTGDTSLDNATSEETDEISGDETVETTEEETSQAEEPLVSAEYDDTTSEKNSEASIATTKTEEATTTKPEQTTATKKTEESTTTKKAEGTTTTKKTEESTTTKKTEQTTTTKKTEQTTTKKTEVIVPPGMDEVITKLTATTEVTSDDGELAIKYEGCDDTADVIACIEEYIAVLVEEYGYTLVDSEVAGTSYYVYYLNSSDSSLETVYHRKHTCQMAIEGFANDKYGWKDIKIYYSPTILDNYRLS